LTPLPEASSASAEAQATALDLSPVLSDSRRVVVIGTLLALASAFLYGTNIPAARAASQAGMPGAELIFYRALWLTPLLGLIALITGQSLRVPVGERGTLARLAVASGLTATLYLSALDHMPVPMTVVLFYTFPLIVMLVSNRLAGRWLGRRQLVIFAIAFTGLAIAVGPSVSDLSIRGVSYALLGATACAALFILAGNMTGPPLRTMFWSQVGVTPIALTFSLLNGGPVPLDTFLKAPIAIAIAMGCYAIAFVGQLMAARRIAPSRAGLLFLFEPVTAILVAGIFLGEQLQLLQMLGVGMILVALGAEVTLDAGWLRRFRSGNARTIQPPAGPA
jgi:drug/metabolite transporter (DMT)-like permease